MFRLVSRYLGIFLFPVVMVSCALFVPPRTHRLMYQVDSLSVQTICADSVIVSGVGKKLIVIKAPTGHYYEYPHLEAVRNLAAQLIKPCGNSGLLKIHFACIEKELSAPIPEITDFRLKIGIELEISYITTDIELSRNLFIREEIVIGQETQKELETGMNVIFRDIILQIDKVTTEWQKAP